MAGQCTTGITYDECECLAVVSVLRSASLQGPACRLPRRRRVSCRPPGAWSLSGRHTLVTGPISPRTGAHPHLHTYTQPLWFRRPNVIRNGPVVFQQRSFKNSFFRQNVDATPRRGRRNVKARIVSVSQVSEQIIQQYYIEEASSSLKTITW